MLAKEAYSPAQEPDFRAGPEVRRHFTPADDDTYSAPAASDDGSSDDSGIGTASGEGSDDADNDGEQSSDVENESSGDVGPKTEDSTDNVLDSDGEVLDFDESYEIEKDDAYF